MASDVRRDSESVHPELVLSPLLSNLGSSTQQQIKRAIDENSIVVFGASYCPFCLEVNRLFKSLGVRYANFNLDKEKDGAALRADLLQLTGQKTVPYVYINQNLVGGCDATKKLQFDGKLFPMIRSSLVQDVESSKFPGIKGSALEKGMPLAPSTFFDFPAVTDDRVIRLVGIQVFILCVMIAAFFNTFQASWVMGGLMVDFVLRFIGGAGISPIGVFAQLLAAIMEFFGSKPRFIAGPPKQFAVAVGILFSSLAFLFFRLTVYVEGFKYAALGVTAVLAAAAALEGVFGFCLGCWMFGQAIRFGIASPDVYTEYANSRSEIEYTWHEMNKVLGELVPGTAYRPFDINHPTQADLHYKSKTEDMTREDHHLIKHVKVNHFILQLGLGGLALAWSKAAEVLGAPHAISDTIALLGVALYVFWLGLYTLKLIMYPGKVKKEWDCPGRGSTMALPLIILMMYAMLVNPHSPAFAKVLFWIGAGGNMAVAIMRVGEWIAIRKDIEHVNAAWMIPPVGNLLAALVGPALDPAYIPAMQFWFAFAFVMWMLVFAITFAKAVLHTEEDDRKRPLVFIWVAAPAIAGLAYLRTFQRTPADPVYLALHWIAFAMALVLMWATYRPYLGRLKFGMYYWAASFPTAGLAVTAMTYYAAFPGGMSHGIAVTCLAATTAIQIMLLMHTMIDILLQRTVFKPEPKWNTLSVVRLLHEATRMALPRLIAAAESVAGGDSSGPAVADLQGQWRMLRVALKEHARIQDDVIYKEFDNWFPGITQQYQDEHESLLEAADRLDDAISALSKPGKKSGTPGAPTCALKPESAAAATTTTQSPTAWKDEQLDNISRSSAAAQPQPAAPADPVQAAAASLLPDLRSLSRLLLAHMRSEEDHIQPIAKRYIPMSLTKPLMAQAFVSGDGMTWFSLLPWAMNNLPMMYQRLRLLKALLWSMPDRAQQFGMMVGLGVDAVMWRRLTTELPELVPRGAPGWVRYH